MAGLRCCTTVVVVTCPFFIASVVVAIVEEARRLFLPLIFRLVLIASKSASFYICLKAAKSYGSTRQSLVFSLERCSGLSPDVTEISYLLPSGFNL